MTHIVEMRPYTVGEDLTNVAVYEGCDPKSDLGMIARHPWKPRDLWYVSSKHLKNSYELVLDDEHTFEKL